MIVASMVGEAAAVRLHATETLMLLGGQVLVALDRPRAAAPAEVIAAAREESTVAAGLRAPRGQAEGAPQTRAKTDLSASLHACSGLFFAFCLDYLNDVGRR